MAAELERQMQDPSTYAPMGFEERIALLVDAEWNSRQNNKLIRCIRDARFAEPGAAVKGASGNGKTYLACALGNAACRSFWRSWPWHKPPES